MKTLSKPPTIPTALIGGIEVGMLNRRQWANLMSAHCKLTRSDPSRRPFVVFSANGQVIAKCAREPDFKALLNQGSAVDADGQPMVWASRLWTSRPLTERVATTDFFHTAARKAAKEGLRFYILGTNQHNLDIALKSIRKRYPKLIIAGSRNGYFTREDEAEICRAIRTAKPDVLWVGLGVPRQEEFVIRNRSNLVGVGWIKTCGGLFDYFSPAIKRAPTWMQQCGLEWLFRTVQEPHKYFWRYFTTNGIAAWYLLTRTRDI